MACREFVPAIAGWLYDEIAPTQAGALRAHLEHCVACREEIERLRSAREALREARPEVPSAPRLFVLRPRTSARWALAAAFLGTGLLATAAFLAGRSLPSGVTSTPPAIAERVPEATPSPVVATPGASGVESVARAVPGALLEGVVTREELERQLALFERRLRKRQTTDLGEVMAEIAGVEARTAARIGQTRDALRYVALANQPDISEQ